jgi:pectate lyase
MNSFARTALAVLSFGFLSALTAIAQVPLLSDHFDDGSRTDLSPTTSAAWYSSATSATVLTNGAGGANGSLALDNGSSRTLVGYFTADGSPATIPTGETMTLTVNFTVTGAPLTKNNGVIFGLLQSVANPAATSGSGFAADGSPNINARVSGDYGSSNPSSGIFSNYTGYAAWTNLNGNNSTLRKRNGSNPGLNNASAAWAQIGSSTGSGTAPVENISYQAVLSLTHTAAGGMDLTYALKQGATVLNTLSSSEAVASFTTFDTVNIYMASSTLDGTSSASLVLNQIDVTLTNSAIAVAPAITTPPADQAVFVGQPASFSVVATGTAPLAYQWRKDGAPIAGATTDTFSIPSAQLADNASYDVVVSNAVDSATSTPATLTVTVAPAAPTITTDPVSHTVNLGESVSFVVIASSESALTYQWRKDGADLPGETGATLAIASAQSSDEGAYDVVVSNAGGSTPSVVATLAVNAPPSILTPPASQSALIGGTVTFNVAVTGSAPFTYQWRKNGTPIPSAINASLTLTNLQTTAAGSYDVVVSNVFDHVTSAAATLSVSAGLPYSSFNLTGFGQATTGGGVIPTTDAGYRQVSTPLEFITALADKTGAVKVIEIMNDLDLGWNEVGATVQDFSIFRQHAAPKLHPRLLVTGVGLIDVQNKTGLTIFSANGACIRHATLNIKSSSNIIVRNLKFDELWEWDEASKGDYDSNDWDFIDLGNAGTVFNIWIDHCTFTKAYDGVSDIKKGSYNITFSWNKYMGDDGATNPNSFVRQQIAALEANRAAYPMFNFLRTNGFSIEDIVTILQGHDKTHLIGANSLDADNNNHTVTFHHQWMLNPWDRLPRLRGGNVHNYNLFVDARLGRAAKALRDARASAMTTSARNTLNNTYNFNVFLNGSISTEGGAILVEKSVYLDVITPLRNNQTDVNNPIYTGKILALDTISQMTSNAGVTTTVRGNSTDAGNPMGPVQAAIIPFSWNLPGGVLPYAAPMDDPAGLEDIVHSGAGAGKLAWSKDNWLKTSYAGSAPVILASPASQTVSAGTNVSLSVAATGAAPLAYQWFKDDAALDNQNDATLNLASVQAAQAGSYRVIVSNPYGDTASESATLTIGQNFASWIAAQGLTGPDAAPDADYDGDGLSNAFEFATGTSPIAVDASAPLTFTSSGDDLVFRFTHPLGLLGVTYHVETSTDLVNWAPSGVAPVVESTTENAETLAVSFPAGQPEFFVRLAVTLE